MFDLPLPKRTPLEQPPILPMTRAEMDALGWSELDILLVTGDAYVDHPAFGVPLLGRWLVAHGFRTGIVSQPAWRDERAGVAAISALGRPRLFAGVSAGALDSMLAHYTAFRRKRHDDAYTPGGRAGARPDRAVTVYARLVHKAFPGLVVAAGGIEASLRRITHYDFWADRLHPSLLFGAGLDLLFCGMGERAILECAQRLDAVAEMVGDLSVLRDAASQQDRTNGPNGPAPWSDNCPDILPDIWPDIWLGIRGTAHVVGTDDLTRICAEKLTDTEGELLAERQNRTQRTGRGAQNIPRPRRIRTEDFWVELPSHAEMLANPAAYLNGCIRMERETHQMRRTMVQKYGSMAVLLERPAVPLNSDELDFLYTLPFSRKAHPAYKQPIPAVEMIATSITTHRGCGGGCSFCSLALHQGRRIASRSRASILEEAARIASQPRGASISDVGGPSANMWGASCGFNPAVCTRDSCLFPSICKGFRIDQKECIELLRDVKAVPGVKHVRVASGVRFDLALRDPVALAAYTGEFTGGQLKIAPEHCVPEVLNFMRKPGMKEFEAFLAAFVAQSKASGKEQYVIPYLMSAFPGCTDEHMRQLHAWLAARHWSPRQVQCFIPTPGTVATAMYYSGLAPDGKPIYVARSDAERRRQHNILLGERPAGRPDGHKTH